MQQILLERKLVPLEINFNNLRSKILRESFFGQFGAILKEILRRMFGDRPPTPEELQKALSEQEDALGPEAANQSGEPVGSHRLRQAQGMAQPQPEGITNTLIVKGTDEEVTSFLDALSAEHSYMDLYLKHGLDDENVREAKYALDEVVEHFERTTGILWPFT